MGDEDDRARGTIDVLEDEGAGVVCDGGTVGVELGFGEDLVNRVDNSARQRAEELFIGSLI